MLILLVRLVSAHTQVHKRRGLIFHVHEQVRIVLRLQNSNDFLVPFTDTRARLELPIHVRCHHILLHLLLHSIAVGRRSRTHHLLRILHCGHYSHLLTTFSNSLFFTRQRPQLHQEFRRSFSPHHCWLCHYCLFILKALHLIFKLHIAALDDAVQLMRSTGDHLACFLLAKCIS